MGEEFREDLALPRPKFYQASRRIAFSETAEGLDKLRDDLAFGFRRVGLRG